MDHKQGIDGDQVFFTSLSDLLPDDSFARVIDVFVDALSLSDLGFKHVELNKEGNELHLQSDLFKLPLRFGEKVEKEVSIVALNLSILRLVQLKEYKRVEKAMKEVVFRLKSPGTHHDGCRQTIIYRINNQVLPTHNASRAA